MAIYYIFLIISAALLGLGYLAWRWSVYTKDFMDRVSIVLLRTSFACLIVAFVSAAVLHSPFVT